MNTYETIICYIYDPFIAFYPRISLAPLLFPPPPVNNEPNNWWPYAADIFTSRVSKVFFISFFYFFYFISIV